MTITTPIALILLLTIPFVGYFGWPRHRFRRWRDSTSLALRSVIMLLLVLSLAGVQVAESADRLAVVFLVDVSDSMGSAAIEAEMDFIRESLQSKGPDDQAAIVVFGANAKPERSMSPVSELEPLRSTPITTNTDLAEAIRTGLAMFPPQTARRMVILSDGQPTVGDTEAAAQLAAASGVEISYVTFARQPAPEVRVLEFRAPRTVNAGQVFDLSVTIEAEDDTPATVTVFAAGEIIHRESVDLRQGANRYTLPLEIGSGFRDFTVRVDPEGNDAFYQNNQLATFTNVVGPPRVLIVSESDTEVEHLIPALQDTGILVDRTTPGGLPTGVGPLTQYQSVILANVPATQLSNRRMTALDSYVKDLGGGLIAIGGPDAYGPGGYFGTPLEDALPVEMQIKDQQRLPQLTLAYLIDRSGSMGATDRDGIPHIELAKEAMIRSIDFLQPTDRAAVASFDTSGSWIARFQPVRDRLSIQRLIATLRPAGGTDIMAGYRLVARDIVAEPSERKHIILLTDGGASPRGLVEMAAELYDNNDVTTSVIAIGIGAAQFLDQMAAAGHGNYHRVENVQTIPAIFTAETVLASRSYIIEEEPFVPTLTAISPIMEGIPALPAVRGYVATTPKLASQVVLRGPEPFADPVLASWQYGLGRAVAFTSDATARWASDWVQWSDFPRFWSQMVRWTMTEGASSNLETRVVLENEQARLIIDARDAEGQFLNGLNLQGRIVFDPQRGAEPITLRQVAPGRYEATFVPQEEGAYFMRITGTGEVDGETLDLSQTTGWVMSYSPEYDPIEGSPDALLERLAALTEGRALDEDTGAVFAHNIIARNATAPLWPWLLLVALILLPFDIAVRRLIVQRSDLIRLREAIMGRQLVPETPRQRLSSLIAARDRARDRTGQPTVSPGATISALRSRREQARDGDEPEPTPAAPPVPADKPRFDRPHPVTQAEPRREEPDENIGARLLKRRRREDEED